MSKLLEWFLLFLATMASSHAKTVASLRMAERCVCTFEREATFKEAAP